MCLLTFLYLVGSKDKKKNDDGLFDYERKHLKDGYEPHNFEEEELEDDDYYFEDDD